MKFLVIIFAWIVYTSAVQALDVSSCDQGCFENKLKCDAKKSHTFNVCHEELVACKSSCKSGRRQEAYRKSPFLEVSLNPVMKFAYKIEHFLIEHDVLIIGKDADFHFNSAQETTIPVRQLLKDNPRPLIITDSELPNQKSSDVIVAFDETFAASRALHMALLMGILKGKSVHIANISENSAEESRDYVNIAAKLCHNHGVNTHLHPLVSSEKPAKILLDLIEDIKPSLFVMGAYGHGGFSHFFWGSCAESLLKSTNVPIFFFH